MTQVKFYTEKGIAFAYFPEMEYYGEMNKKDAAAYGFDLRMRSSYQHIGQHSACHPDYVKNKRLAQYGTYCFLLMELIGQGYNDLMVLNLKNDSRDCHRPPTKQEVKRGYGATHYRTFTLAEIGLNKRGLIKKWFVAKDDQLRYYTD